MTRNTRLLLTLGATAGVAIGALPAFAATRDVGTGPGNVFTPASLAVDAGDTVRVRNTGRGFHDLRWTDRSANELPASTDEWTVERAFPAAGTFTYYCTIHSSGAGSGMSGEVVVTGAGPAPAPTPVPTPEPTPGPEAESGVAPNALRVTIRGLSRDRTGRRARVTVTVDRATTVELRLKREIGGGRLQTAGTVVLKVPAGTSTRTIRRTRDGSPLRSGRLRAQVVDRATGTPQRRTVRFAVPR